MPPKRKGTARRVVEIRGPYRTNEEECIVLSDDGGEVVRPNTDEASTSKGGARTSTPNPGDSRGAEVIPEDISGDILTISSPNTENSLQ